MTPKKKQRESSASRGVHKLVSAKLDGNLSLIESFTPMLAVTAN